MPDPKKIIKFCDVIFPKYELTRELVEESASIEKAFRFDDDKLVSQRPGWQIRSLFSLSHPPRVMYVHYGIEDGKFGLEVWHAAITGNSTLLLMLHPFHGDFLKQLITESIFPLFEKVIKRQKRG